MRRKHFKVEQIIVMLRESQIGQRQEMRVRDICRGFEMSEQTYYRWRREYVGLKVSQPKWLKELKGGEQASGVGDISWCH